MTDTEACGQVGGRFAQLGSTLFAGTKAAFEQVHESLNKELDVVESYLNNPGQAAKASRASSRSVQFLHFRSCCYCLEAWMTGSGALPCRRQQGRQGASLLGHVALCPWSVHPRLPKPPKPAPGLGAHLLLLLLGQVVGKSAQLPPPAQARAPSLCSGPKAGTKGCAR